MDSSLPEFTRLMEKIIMNAGRNIPEKIEEGIRKLLIAESVPVQHCRKVVTALSQRENLPTNLYGLIDSLLMSYKRDDDKQLESRESWSISENDMCAPGEFSLYWEIHKEIMLWHKIGLVQTNHDSICFSANYIPQNIDEWVANPIKTWSPLLDHYLEGLGKVTNLDWPHRKAFYEKYLSMLQAERVKRGGMVIDSGKNEDFEIKKKKYLTAYYEKYPEKLIQK